MQEQGVVGQDSGGARASDALADRTLPAPEPSECAPQLACTFDSECARADDVTPAPALLPSALPAPLPAPLIDERDLRTLPQIWLALQRELCLRIKKEQFETWFRRATLQRASEEGVCIAVQNTFARDWLKKNYQPALEQSVCAVFGEARAVEFEVDPELALAEAPARDLAEPSEAASSSPPNSSSGEPSSAKSSAHPAAKPRSATSAPERDPAWLSSNKLLWASDVVLNPNYRFDSFVVGPCNRFAHAASVGVSETPGQVYNPFFLHGSVGLGKTHLLQSLCYSLLERTPDTRILYLSCETFTNHFISALENGDLQKFRNKYRNVDVLVVDDIHMLANKERTQEEFFHTFNTLYNAGKQIVLSSDSPPKEIPTLQERLVSRFKWGLVTEIEAPCYETRMAILKRKSKERGHELPEPVASLLAEHIDTNIRELEGAVTRVLGFAGLSGQEVSIDLARKVLRDVFTSKRGLPTMEDVLRLVTAHFNIKVTELQGRRRTNAIARPRQVGMFLARKITRHSLEEIGGFFGGRDHSTVLHAIERVETEIRRDERFRALVAGFLDQLQRHTS